MMSPGTRQAWNFTTLTPQLSASPKAVHGVVVMDDDFGDETDLAAVAASFDRQPPKPAGGTSASSNAPKIKQPTPQALPSRNTPSAILVSTRQKGNPSLNYIRSLPWEYSDIPSDYVLGATTCALFLSLKYHRLHPEYIYSRIRALGHKYNLRILLTMVDIDNHEESLKELSKTSLINNLTLILCWSAQEAGRYLELYKSYEHASPTSIRAHQSTSYADKLVEFVTVPRSVNKTDAVSLVSAFGSVRAAVNAQPEQIAEITGWGEKKVQRWCETVRENFRIKKAGKRALGLGGEESSRGFAREETSMGDGSNPRPPTATGPQEVQEKRPAKEVSLWEAGNDDDDALLAAAEAESEGLNVITAQDGKKAGAASKTSAKSAEKLDDGVAAALAKLRKE